MCLISPGSFGLALEGERDTVLSAKTVEFPLFHSLANIFVMQ